MSRPKRVEITEEPGETPSGLEIGNQQRGGRRREDATNRFLGFLRRFRVPCLLGVGRSVLDAGETTVGSSVCSHGRSQRPSGGFGRRCRRRACRWSVSVGRENKEQPSGKRSVTTRSHSFRPTMPPQKVVSTPYRLIDADPHASRVISYMRPSDYAVWGGATAAAPAALYLWGNISRSPETLAGRLTAVLYVVRPC